MPDALCSDDPEPSEPVPAGLLCVPVRPGPAGCAARLFRTPIGDRTAVGFTSPALLTSVLGPEQAWIRLSEPALRALVSPLGVTALTVDPKFAASPVAPPAASPVAATAPRHRSTWRDWDPQAIGVLRVTGAAALVGALNLWLG
ncbi:SAV_915 family protein [Streptomyces sp. NPDC058231]|uniref:SAV_915 family protein n=1 Tax=Streptomyces sp. NPDC058231 TaxID=3346392 RepID=UPI0036E8CD58